MRIKYLVSETLHADLKFDSWYNKEHKFARNWFQPILCLHGFWAYFSQMSFSKFLRIFSATVIHLNTCFTTKNANNNAFRRIIYDDSRLTGIYNLQLK